MDIRELQHNWDRFGKRDPMWAILTSPQHRDGKWQNEVFFQSGEADVALLLNQLRALDVPLGWERALDFGCGLGRLTQALCVHYAVCDGVDIAPSMIEQARRYNRYGERCHYHVNDTPDLRRFDDASFDLVYSILVLQHMQPVYGLSYLAEFLRVLKPGGIAVFQAPSEKLGAAAGLRYRLPDDGFRAEFRVARPPQRLRPGQPFQLEVLVRNSSAASWPAQVPTAGTGYIRLGNHWLAADGTTVQYDDGRTIIPHDLAPGQEVTLPLTVTAPTTPGNYLLEFDMVQEGIAWFSVVGSPTLRLPVSCRDTLVERWLRRPAPPAAPPSDEPVMEMHCLPREEVLATVAAHGGRALQVEANSYCGAEWTSFTYVVQREAS